MTLIIVKLVITIAVFVAGVTWIAGLSKPKHVSLPSDWKNEL